MPLSAVWEGWPVPRAVVITTLLAPRAVGAGGPGPVETPHPVQWQCHAGYAHCTVGLCTPETDVWEAQVERGCTF